jgi:6-phosphofructokinase
VLERDIREMGSEEDYWRTFRVFANEPRHIIRSSAPMVVDTILAERLGTLAVDSAMAGYSDFMISQWLTEYVLVPLPLVVLGRKRVPQDGIFWNSVVASIEAHSKVAADFFETVEEAARQE